MCLAIPGKIIAIDDSAPLRMATVDFGGVYKSICIQYVDASTGDFILPMPVWPSPGSTGGGRSDAGRFRPAGSLPNPPTTMWYDQPFREAHHLTALLRAIRQEATCPIRIMEVLRRSDLRSVALPHRRAAARHRADDSRPGLPRVRHPRRDCRPGSRDSPPTRHDPLLVRRHDTGTRQRRKSLPTSGAPRGMTFASSIRRSTRWT